MSVNGNILDKSGVSKRKSVSPWLKQLGDNVRRERIGQGQVGTHPGPAGLAATGPSTFSRQLATAQVSRLRQDDVPDRNPAAGADSELVEG